MNKYDIICIDGEKISTHVWKDIKYAPTIDILFWHPFVAQPGGTKFFLSSHYLYPSGPSYEDKHVKPSLQDWIEHLENEKQKHIYAQARDYFTSNFRTRHPKGVCLVLMNDPNREVVQAVVDMLPDGSGFVGKQMEMSLRTMTSVYIGETWSWKMIKKDKQIKELSGFGSWVIGGLDYFETTWPQLDSDKKVFFPLCKNVVIRYGSGAYPILCMDVSRNPVETLTVTTMVGPACGELDLSIFTSLKHLTVEMGGQVMIPPSVTHLNTRNAVVEKLLDMTLPNLQHLNVGESIIDKEMTARLFEAFPTLTQIVRGESYER
jgi:hypothetical protein